MSPSVTHIQSPIPSQNESQSTQPRFPPNPNPNFHKPPHFSSFAASISDLTSFNSSNIGTATTRVANDSFHSLSESRVSSVESKVVLNSSSRSRPRLVKVRKQNVSQHAMSKSVKENTNRGKDNFNNFVNFNKSQFGDTVNFVFGDNNNNSKSNIVLNSKLFNEGKFGVHESGNIGGFGLGNKESVRKVGSLDFDGLGKSSNFVFASDADVVNSSSSFGSNSKLFNGVNGGPLGVNESRSIGGFGLGNKETVRKVGNMDFDGLGKSSNFVYASDANIGTSTSSFSSEANEATENVERYDAERKKGEEGTKPELRRFDNVDFVFGATDRDSLSNLNLDKKEADATSFVFGAGGNDLRTTLNSKQVGINGSIGKSFSFDNGNLKSTSNRGNNGNVGFVFGGCKNDSASITDAGTPQYGENADKFSFLHSGKTNVDGETEHCNSKVNGVFVFGSGSKGSFHSSRGSQPGNDMKNLNFKKTENCNDELKGKGNSTGSASKSMFNFVFGNSCKLGNSFSGHAYKLSDEMKKMNIHDSEIVDDADTCKSSSTGSFSDLSNKFVFLSNNKASVSSTGNSNFTSHPFQNAHAAINQNGQGVKNIDVGLGNNEKNVGSFGESVENKIPDTARNKDTRFGTGLYSGPNIPSFSSFGTRGKENKSINLTENGMDEKQNFGNQTSLNNGVGGSFYPSSSSSMGFGCQSFDSVYEAPTGDRAEKKDKEFTFTSTPVQLSPSFTGFSTPNLYMPANLFPGDGALRKDKEFTSTNTSIQPGPSITGLCTPEPANLFSGISMTLDFSISNVSARGSRLKKTRGKLRQHKVSRDFNSQQNEAPLDCGSPMDFSPYQKASCADASHSKISSETANEGLAAARERSDEKGDRKWSEENEKGLKDHHGTEPQINFKTERFSNNVSASIAAETRASNSTIEREECNGNSQHYSASTRRSLKKYRMKIGHGSDSTSESWKAEFASSSVNFVNLINSSIQSDGFQAQRADILNTQSKGEHRPFKNERTMKQDLNEAATIEACEKWRISGNQAYRRGSLPKAENYYTKCINAITQMKTPACCIEPLVLCYSNRAATRLCLGRIREALRDCNSAVSLDSNFQKVLMRAANCHLLLGEVEDAMLYFNKCLESSADVCLDRRIMIEAADGLQKSQKVIECTIQSAELLQQRTSDAASKALRTIMEALTISSHSEKLLELKGEALCMLRKYEEVVQLCEQTLGFAEKNFTGIDTAGQLPDTDSCNGNNSDIRLWRWRLMSKSYFHMGRLEASLDLIKQQEQLRSIDPRCRSKGTDSSVSLAATVRELLELKNAGNKAFQCGEHTEAVEHYTAAISSSVQSRPFTAVCFCNRAAAHQALGKISDAIADCSLALALNENYEKALSRRATLHEMIRDYGQAANDLQRFINLQKQSKGRTQESDSPLGTGEIRDYAKEARNRFSSVERKAKKGAPLDFYLLLGIKASDTASDIKKAYHRAALKHHPDKAGQFLVRTESLEEGPLGKEIVEKIHVDADRLFKMIGEAYAVLSDNNKRAKYDLEEEIRKENYNTTNSSGRESNVYSSPFNNRSSREYGHEWGTYGGESWKTYGKSRSRW